MVRTVLQCLLTLLVIVASVEGTIDRASAGHPHGEEPVHELASFDAHEHAQPAADEGHETPDSHCEHCCHGHSSGIASAITFEFLDFWGDDAVAGHDDHIKTLAVAPPTPPPTA